MEERKIYIDSLSLSNYRDVLKCLKDYWQDEDECGCYVVAIGDIDVIDELEDKILEDLIKIAEEEV